MRLTIDLNVNVTQQGAEAPPWALQILNMLGVIIQKENSIMSAQTDALDQAEAAAAANSAADDAAEALLVTLSGLVRDLSNNQTDPATVDRINALAAAINDRANKLGAAVAAGTPSAPTV
jgi:hypothetical protein